MKKGIGKEKIELHNAIMIIGLEGWGNGGKVSTFSVKYLTDKLRAKRFGEIPAEGLYDYLIERPIVSIKEGLVQSYYPPRNDLFYWRNKEGEADLVLLLGHEPHLNWTGYAKSILHMTKETGVKRIYTIGGYITDISHEDEALITSSTNNEGIISELKKAGLEPTNYRGPTSVYSEILWRAREKNLDVVSLWIGIPIFVTGVYPRATHDMLRKLVELIGLELDLGDLEKEAEIFEREVMGQPRRIIEDLRRRTSQDRRTAYIS